MYAKGKTKVSLGLVNTLLNWFTNKQNISYLLSVNVLFSGLSSGPTSCLQILYLLAYLKKCLWSTLILEKATCSSLIFSFKWLLLMCSSIGSSCKIILGVRKMILLSLVLLRIKTLRSFWNLDFLASFGRFNGTWIEYLDKTFKKHRI